MAFDSAGDFYATTTAGDLVELGSNATGSTAPIRDFPIGPDGEPIEAFAVDANGYVYTAYARPPGQASPPRPQGDYAGSPLTVYAPGSLAPVMTQPTVCGYIGTPSDPQFAWKHAIRMVVKKSAVVRSVRRPADRHPCHHLSHVRVRTNSVDRIGQHL
ncbi:MAG: hypothetical protein ACREM8_04000 [Vulcanimicrobiaceae bacterium]